MSANELKKMRNYKSGKRQHVGSPVTKRAVRLHFVSDIKTFDKCASEYDAQNDSHGNPAKKSSGGIAAGAWNESQNAA
jgi:hypothetical protein